MSSSPPPPIRGQDGQPDECERFPLVTPLNWLIALLVLLAVATLLLTCCSGVLRVVAQFL